MTPSRRQQIQLGSLNRDFDCSCYKSNLHKLSWLARVFRLQGQPLLTKKEAFQLHRTKMHPSRVAPTQARRRARKGRATKGNSLARPHADALVPNMKPRRVQPNSDCAQNPRSRLVGSRHWPERNRILDEALQALRSYTAPSQPAAMLNASVTKRANRHPRRALSAAKTRGCL